MHHDLLSVRTWRELPARDQLQYNKDIYESCRIAAILFSNAVIYPIPLTYAVRSRLLGELLQYLRGSEYVLLRDSSLLLWVLFVGGMIAHGTLYQEAFAAKTRSLLVPLGSPSLEAVEQMLATFVWSRPSCSAGAAVFWRTVHASRTRSEVVVPQVAEL
jgi:hypothetical protein